MVIAASPKNKQNSPSEYTKITIGLGKPVFHYYGKYINKEKNY